MVIKEREPKSGDAKGEGQGAPLPYLGRSVRVVGQWDSVDAAQTPHEKNKRGELGKTLFNYYFNRTSPDPLGRTSTNNYGADRRNVLASVVGRGTRGGEVNADRVDVADPAAMTRHIKTVAKFLGASDVGIAQLHPSMLYAGGRGADDGTGGTEDGQAPGEPTSETVKKYPYAIACVGAWDYELGKAHRHRIGDFTYHESGDRLQITFANLMQYIKDLGYSAVRGPAQAMPVALAAGLGEVGRNGMLITKSYGARVHLGTPILTDLPLVSDKPLDIGVEDFCRICKKCATTCPTNSISVGGKAVINGIEKYKINWETCYRLRAHVKAVLGHLPDVRDGLPLHQAQDLVARPGGEYAAADAHPHPAADGPASEVAGRRVLGKGAAQARAVYELRLRLPEAAQGRQRGGAGAQDGREDRVLLPAEGEYAAFRYPEGEAARPEVAAQ